MGSQIARCCSDDSLSKKLKGINTSQKLEEIKAYRFFIDSLERTIKIADCITNEEFFFIKNEWMENWLKYTKYEEIENTLGNNEINNRIDFGKLILDQKNDNSFISLTAKEKPNELKFLEVVQNHGNIQKNFFFLDFKTVEFFVGVYGTKYDYFKHKNLVCVEGEIGKGRVLFRLNDEVILLVYLNDKNNFKQTALIFDDSKTLKNTLENLKGRALSTISKEIQKFTKVNNCLIYKRENITIYDNRKIAKDNPSVYFKKDKGELRENIDNDKTLIKDNDDILMINKIKNLKNRKK